MVHNTVADRIAGHPFYLQRSGRSSRDTPSSGPRSHSAPPLSRARAISKVSPAIANTSIVEESIDGSVDATTQANSHMTTDHDGTWNEDPADWLSSPWQSSSSWSYYTSYMNKDTPWDSYNEQTQ